jgi:tetratricopeptide (TPR) repeat protein
MNAPGKNYGLWGLSDQGKIWVDLLTDSKGQYIEFQSGKLFNQAMEKSSETPFKHRDFYPHDADIMREIWFPLKGTGGMVAASRYGVLNVVRKKDSVHIFLSALQKLDETLKVRSNDQVIVDEKISLKPLELYQSEIKIREGEQFNVELGNQLISYTSEEDLLLVERPLGPNEEFDWNSAIGLYTRGVELEKQQTYLEGNAFVRAQEYYLESLEKDPAYAPALNRLALSYYRQMNYEKALTPVKKSLSIDTYDGEANYYYGLIQSKLGNIPDAKSGFSIAAQHTAYRTAAYTELAVLFLVEKNNSRAMEYARKALIFNQNNLKALEILALAYRMLNKPELYKNILSRIHELDATSAFVVFEKIHKAGEKPEKLRELITNELAFQTYLDLGIRYLEYGFSEESIMVLKAAPEHVLVLLWLAFLDVGNREEWFEKATLKSPDFVFPYRSETYRILEELMTIEDTWKLKYYMSLICWKKGMFDEARKLMAECGNEPDYAPFYLAKARLYSGEQETVKASLQKAFAVNNSDWRVNLAMIDLLISEKKYMEAAGLAKKSLGMKPEMAILGIKYGIALLRSGDYEKCLDFLKSFVVLPYEGANEGRNVYHEACIRSSLGALKRNNYKKAIHFAEKASQWPLNLGAGRPFDVDEKLENYIMAYSHERSGNLKAAEEFYKKIADDIIPPAMNEKTSFYLQLKALRKLNREQEAIVLLQDIEKKKTDDLLAAWAVEKEKQGNPDAIANKISSDIQGTKELNDHFLLVNDLFSIIE